MRVTACSRCHQCRNWVKLRKSHNEQMSSALDPTTDMARLQQRAANMGTSVEMIDDFYGTKRMRDPKMATELTKRA